jgi:hypothetical protein
MIIELIVAAAFWHVPLVIPNYEETPAGDIIILGTNGGYFNSFASIFDHWQEKGKRLIITGPCLSACTIALGNPKACAMPEAYFGFHQSRRYNNKTKEFIGTSEEVNRLLWERYPAKVRATIKELTPELKYVKGTDLLPPCPSTTRPVSPEGHEDPASGKSPSPWLRR